MKITLVNLLFLSLASFRLTRLLIFDKITDFMRAPFFDQIREEKVVGEIEVYYLPKKTGIKKFIGELLSCYWCTGIWASAGIVGFFLLCPDFSIVFILVLAVAGLASIMETIMQQFMEK